MASNMIRSGDVLPIALPYGRAAGEMFQVGTMLAVALATGTAGDVVNAARVGEFTLTCVGTDTCATAGIKLYWDNGNRRLTTTASTHQLAGHSTAAKGSGPTTVDIVLVPLGT